MYILYLMFCHFKSPGCHPNESESVSESNQRLRTLWANQ